ncbi:stage III sporulation protein SpoIIIAB [Thermoactinomyces sp. DSM 45892]|uniref:stage III sporulation protein SpoIIIAB n=1 Tax=Thermoactinomyces sp. DSM 45892 TaxID=1882753 RepID=UPI00089B45EE|nr:stage III sporulation protein SpoIIIAB [Thermoactinomyces sp. DSM 45892]SDX99866.1 stage III sporulation protein AB [Thermoactinomyces sp. DSM 45892]
MLKLLGACIILIGTTWAGFQHARTFAERPKQIRQVRSALQLLETEIGYGTRTLIDACQSIAARMDGFVQAIFQQAHQNLLQLDGASTYECFVQAIESNWGATCMKQSEKQVILDFCKTLGISDRQDQLQNLAVTKSNLEIEEHRAQEEQIQYEKMFKTLGILAGALLIILMY